MMNILKHSIVLLFVAFMSHGIMAQHPAPEQNDTTLRSRYDMDIPLHEGIANTGGEYTTDTNEIFYFVDEEPAFKENMNAFIAQNYIIPNNWEPGFIYVAFVVEKDGTVTDVKVLIGKGLTPQQNIEAERVIRMTSGKWIPGKINGEPVRVAFKQKFIFTEEN